MVVSKDDLREIIKLGGNVCKDSLNEKTIYEFYKFMN
jgi:hypothetical protein